MTFRSQFRWLLPAILLLALLTLAAPVTAFADSLSWSQTYFGPSDIPNPDPEKLDTPVAARFNGVAFFDATHGWAVGTLTDSPGQFSTPEFGLAAYTNNGGSTWTTYTPPATELLSVAAPATDKVFATTSAGKIVHWNGLNWTEIVVSGWPTSGSSRALRGIAFTDASHGWAVGDRGGVVKTTDGGSTWSTVVAPVTGQPALFAISAAGASRCIAVGDSGSMKSITSSGVSGISSPISSALKGVSFVDAQNGWAVGAGATMLRTSDSGAHWSVHVAPLPPGLRADQLSINAVTFADPSNIVAVGTYQQVWRSFDGGNHWEVGAVPGGLGDGELRAIGFVPGDSVHPVAAGGAYQAQLSQSSDKARAYRGVWTGRVMPPPAAPSSVTATALGDPGPRVAVSWPASSGEDGYAIERSKDSATGPWSGVATTAVDVTSWTDTGVDWSSTWYYRIRAFNSAGQSAWVQSGGIRVDTTAPVTGSNAEVLYVSSAVITLTATDGGSGVAATEWSLDGHAGTGTTVATSALGPHTLEFRSTDEAGNVEPWKSVAFYVSDNTVPDSTKPVTTITNTVHPYYTVPTIVSLVATDAGGSGLFNTYCRIDGASAVATTSIALNATGTHTIEYWSVDLAGNVENARSATFTVLIRPSSTGQPSRPVTPLTVTRSKAFTTYGYVKRYSKTYSLRLYFYRFESGKWVYKTYDTTSQYRVSVAGTDFNKYRASTTLTKTGKWRVRARHVVGSKTVYSAYQYFTVK